MQIRLSELIVLVYTLLAIDAMGLMAVLRGRSTMAKAG